MWLVNHSGPTSQKLIEVLKLLLKYLLKYRVECQVNLVTHPLHQERIRTGILCTKSA